MNAVNLSKSRNDLGLKYSANQVVSIIGCTPAQFKDWTRVTSHRQPLVEPTFKSIGPPAPNHYSLADLVKFEIVKKLTLLGTDRGRIHNIISSHASNTSLMYPFNVLLGSHPATLEDMNYIKSNLATDQRVYLRIECFDTMAVATMAFATEESQSPIKFKSYFRINKNNWTEIFKDNLSKAESLEIKEETDVAIEFELLSIVKKLWDTAKKL